MADNELFDRILIAGDIRGGRGEPGLQGERGLPADVTGQSLYEHSVATGFEGTYDDWLREYLARQTDLPWCSGYFQNRSIAASTHTTVTPVATRGDTGLINGNLFKARTSGVHSLSLDIILTGGPAGRRWTFARRSEPLDGNDALASASLSNETHFPALAWVGHMSAGESISVIVSSGNAVTMSGSNTFNFAQLTEETA